MKTNLFIFGFTSLLLASCSNNDSETANPDSALNKEILTNTSVNVITATYSELYNNSVALTTACQNLSIGDEAELTAVKNAWVATRAPWEKSEGFLYGPVDTEGIDPAIDSWPVDVNAINNILNSSQAITSTLLENDDARGFHTIEYFIWGLSGNKTASELTTRELEYLVAAAQNLQSKTQQLYYGWLQSQGNFANNFVNAGQSGSIYTSQKDALLELVEGIIIISDEVATGKIETPLNGNNGAASPQDEESRFSNNSKLDFANNIRSIQNIYLGDFASIEGKGLTDLVASKNATTDANIKAKITEAISAIEAIPGTFTDAIFNHRSAVQNAQQKVAELKVVLESQLQPLISNL
ncbi:imelysin [Flavobacterium sp. CYK-4]|uniref:imelysin family protein n=1 Tax=Flavobacterium lotistagni TaxID=2709660 RepID=UPI001407C9FE|nr:imelysin family protein [Flavobacterium lotistagni]NHM06340.1 imelysin [Flavobacterium lotistagni]